MGFYFMLFKLTKWRRFDLNLGLNLDLGLKSTLDHSPDHLYSDNIFKN